MTLSDLEARFAHASTEPARHRDQLLGIVACREALAAARVGNYGVGAVLVDPNGSVVEPRGLPAEDPVALSYREYDGCHTHV